MFLFILILLAVTVATEKDDNCPANDDDSFCEMIETDTDDYYIGCDEDPSAYLLPHPEYCTLYIQCYTGLYVTQRTSVTKCCPGYDYTGDGCNDARLWFNTETN